MKKCFKSLLVLLLFTVLSLTPVNPQSWAFTKDFLDTAEDVGTNTVAENGAGNEFISNEVWVSRRGYGSIALITCEFTRAAGSSSTVDFYFQVSYDDGTTWSDYDKVEIPTNTTVISGTTVRVSYVFHTSGASHWRLSVIDNNDASNALTACNASISVGRS